MGTKKKAQTKKRRKQQKDRERRLAEVVELVAQHGPRKKLPRVKVIKEG